MSTYLQTLDAPFASTLSRVGPEPHRDEFSDARRDPRYSVNRPVMGIPIFSNHRPDIENRFEGATINVSSGGLLLSTNLRQRPASNRLLVGVETDSGAWSFATLEVRRTESVGEWLQVAGRFAPEPRDLLREENLTPVLNSKTHCFETRLPQATLGHWARLGVLRPVIVDRFLACPQCQAAPTFRKGCRGCGSPNTTSATMIHHYACAHVGEAENFEQHGELCCPKCRTRSLVVGSDYEYLQGPHTCRDCGWSDTQLETVGRCRACDLQFPISHCREQELVGYDVDRLDPLVLIDAIR